ncbi:MAG: hypothetical protein NC122_04825 [Faecalibacterium sp.]|nr:hypothetical protein [Ruminococcus sp.]MCM1391521.1 hypothetical protein [Ruminococcus sp.]MCM1485509.1 hypothetical protein [Faecalibacterium sp.]
MGKYNSPKIEAKEIYEMTVYLNDEEYDRLNCLVRKFGFDRSKVLRTLLEEPLVVENNWEQWRKIIVPFRRLLGVYSQLCNLINEKAPIYEKLNSHKYKLCEADKKMHNIFIPKEWKKFLNSKKKEKSKG